MKKKLFEYHITHIKNQFKTNNLTSSQIARSLNVHLQTFIEFCNKHHICRPTHKESTEILRKQTIHKRSILFIEKCKSLNIKILSQYQNAKTKVHLQCHCGKKWYGIPDSIINNKTKSCGCINCTAGPKHKGWTGGKLISGKEWGSFLSAAKKRNITVDINIQQVESLIDKQGYICNLSGEQSLYFDQFHNTSYQILGNASIDRINSLDHYHMNNIQIVHKIVNQMKNDLSEEWFLGLIKLIIEPNQFYISDGCYIIQKSKRFTGYGNITGSYWSKMKSDHKRHINWDWTDRSNIKYCWELFLKQRGCCVYTGLPLVIKYSKKLINGKQIQLGNASLDRIDSTKGCIRGNIQWIHKDLNDMKWDLSNKEFLGWCQKIYDYKSL